MMNKRVAPWICAFAFLLITSPMVCTHRWRHWSDRWNGHPIERRGGCRGDSNSGGYADKRCPNSNHQRFAADTFFSNVAPGVYT